MSRKITFTLTEQPGVVVRSLGNGGCSGIVCIAVFMGIEFMM